MMKIINDVYQLQASGHSHVYLIKSKENILIDTGLPGLSSKILKELTDLGVMPKDLHKILLTHHDVDHIGNASKLQKATNAQLWAPSMDIPYILGEKKREGMKRIIQGLMKIEVPNISGNYEENNPLEEIKAIPAPGHTPGHTIFQYKNILFTGDMFRINNGKLKLMPTFMNWNQEEVIKSLSLLKQLKYDWICPSHSQPTTLDKITLEFQ